MKSARIVMGFADLLAAGVEAIGENLQNMIVGTFCYFWRLSRRRSLSIAQLNLELTDYDPTPNILVRKG